MPIRSFHRITRIQALHLGQYLCLYLSLFGDVVNLNERRVSDQAEDIVVKIHC
jgi:hypothetical protein